MIKIQLTAYNMGEVDEADYDAWARYVVEHIDAGVGFEVDEVSQHRFVGGPAEDTIMGGTDKQRAAIREWLDVTGWEAFCADASAWPQRAMA
jgi:hypothetical protein